MAVNNIHTFQQATPPPTQKAGNGFWRRQFGPAVTTRQRVFDWIFGIALPIVCFVFDPIVFKGNVPGDAVLRSYRPFAYLLFFFSVLAMSLWLIFGAKLKWLSGFLSGLFIAGAFVSLAVGLILLPFSLIGLVILIGALGFTPFFTSIVFARNVVRAFRSSKPFLEKSVMIYAVCFGAFFSLLVPVAVQRDITATLTNIERHDAVDNLDLTKLRLYAPLYDAGRLIDIYHSSNKNSPDTAAKRELMRELYNDRTGRDIDNDYPFGSVSD